MSIVESAVPDLLTDDMAWFFPEIDAGMRPFGSRILVQIRGVKDKVSGFYVSEKTKDIQRDNTQVAKVIAIGPLAYKNRNTMEEWAEGAWCKPGDFVWMPKYGGDRFEVVLPKPLMHVKHGSVEKAQFALFDDLNILTHVNDPLTIPFFLGA